MTKIGHLHTGPPDRVTGIGNFWVTTTGNDNLGAGDFGHLGHLSTA